jgi:hypothetical protein
MHLHTQMKPWIFFFCLKSRSSFSRHYSLFAFCNFEQPSRLAYFGPLLTKLCAQVSTWATSSVRYGHMGSSKSKRCTSLLAIFTRAVVFRYIFYTLQTHGGNFLLVFFSYGFNCNVHFLCTSAVVTKTRLIALCNWVLQPSHWLHQSVHHSLFRTGKGTSMWSIFRNHA